MSNAFVDSKYFSGQGVLMLATKAAVTGEPEGFMPVGNVPNLTVGISVTKYEHKESQSGVRGVDFEQAQEVGVSAKFTIEHFSKENIALASYGTSAAAAAGVDIPQTVVGYHGRWTALDHVAVDSVVLMDDGDLTTYERGTDYLLNEDAGSFMCLDTGTITDGQILHAVYDHEAQDEVEGLISSSAPIRWARFEGLNTANSDSPVIVNIFKLSIQPLAEMALIQDEVAGFAVECKGLADGTRSAGSKYWNMRKT